MARNVSRGGEAAHAAAETIVDALSLTGNTHFARITVKNISTAANAGYFGASDVTTSANRHGELVAGESKTWGDDGRGYVDAADIYLVGTVNAANVWLIDLEE